MGGCIMLYLVLQFNVGKVNLFFSEIYNFEYAPSLSIKPFSLIRLKPEIK